jgi:RHS repeat-associated protein
LVFDNSGIIIGSQDYTGFGSLVASTGSGLDRYGYTGREWDNTLSLQYSRARIYDPATGRFLSTDPLGFSAGDVNLYRYVANSPTNASDPSGCFWFVPGLFGGLISSGIYLFSSSKPTWGGFFGSFAAGFGAGVLGITGLRSGLGKLVSGGIAAGYDAFWQSVYSQMDETGKVDPLKTAADTGVGTFLGVCTVKIADKVADKVGKWFGKKAKPNEALPEANSPSAMEPPVVAPRGRGRPLGGREDFATPQATPNEFGTHTGKSSGRSFSPEELRLEMQKRTTEGVTITDEGIAIVEQHVARFGPAKENQQMIQRLRDIATGKVKPTQTDLNYFTHELRELEHYKAMGWERGVPTDPDEAWKLWNNAHTATLEEYGLKEGPGVLYHPEFLE